MGFLVWWCDEGVYYVAAGFSYIVSILAPPSLAQLVGCVTIFSNSMFAGGAPVLKQLQQVRAVGVTILACSRRLRGVRFHGF